MAVANVETDPRSWRECATWLTSMRILSPNHPVNSPEAQPVDLAQVLGDGVLVCYLAKKLNSQCIDSKKVTSRSPTPKFLQLRNWSLFLDACTDHFHISVSEDFDPSSLLDSINFREILLTLSKLSHCTSASSFGIEGFLSNGVVHTVVEDYDILRSSRAKKTTPRSSGLQSIYESFSDFTTSEVKPIYDSLLNPEDYKSKLADEDPIEKRRPVIDEICYTERSFLRTLRTIDNIFSNFLVSRLQGDALEFSAAISKLVQVHSDLYSQLLASSSLTELLNWMSHWSERLLSYDSYIFKLKSAQKAITEQLNNPTISKQIEDHLVAKNYPRNGLATDLILQPYQRACRYPLLLKRLRELTPKEQEDYPLINECIDDIEDVVSFIDQVKQNSDDLTTLADIREMIRGTKDLMDVDNLGFFLMDDEVRVSRNGRSKLQYLFLFFKRLIICDKKRNGSYHFSKSIVLENYRIQDLPTASIKLNTWSYKWKLFDPNEGESSIITLCTKSEAQKSKWIDKFNEAFDHLDPPEILRSTRHIFQITTFPRIERCSLCSRLLKGRHFQGYRCDICKLVSHRNCLGCCSPCRAPPSNLDRFPWYAGKMDREVANQTLSSAPEGTFLLRYRIENSAKRYAISFTKSPSGPGDIVRHLRIAQKKDRVSGVNFFYLREDKRFLKLEELVEWHKSLPLCEYFSHLQNCTLSMPWKQIFSTAIVHSDYADELPNTLNIENGLHVVIVSKGNAGNGWWLAKIGNREGYIPYTYVTEYSIDLG